MNSTLLSLLAVLLVLPPSLLAVRAQSSRRSRGAAVLAAVLVLPAAAALSLLLLGRPLPVVAARHLPWLASVEEPLVLGQKVLLGRAIFVLLDTGEGAPVYLELPWSKRLADELQQALESGQATLEGWRSGNMGEPGGDYRPGEEVHFRGAPPRVDHQPKPEAAQPPVVIE